MHKVVFLLLLLTAGVLAGAGCNGGRPEPLPPPTTDNPIDTYQITVGDVLSIDGGKNQEVSKDQVRVDEEGQINLIFIGKVKAKGVTKSKLEDEINRRYKEAGHFTDPQVSVTVLTLSYFVDGQVLLRGQKKYVRQITLYQAIIDAGGFTEYASRGRVAVLRRQPDGTVKRYVVNVKRIMSGRAPDSFVVRPNDTIVVPRGY
ncbi:MAG: polysaccharide biosynthesis/export family protein [Verrucomicrobia bacterium]|nr:polysaccharide biosynthesis/export family protein [Verrucomicrobiota bacterium]